MQRRPRAQMIAETRAKLIAAGRAAFGTVGYAQTSMDELTAAAGLTRGALHHHFGDKKGLFAAVLAEIDGEIYTRLHAVSSQAADPWAAFRDEWAAYIAMTLEPEIQRILFCDGPAVLGDPWHWPTQNQCIRSTVGHLTRLADAGVIANVDVEAAARLIVGASQYAAQWIAQAPNPEEASRQAIAALDRMLEGFLARP